MAGSQISERAKGRGAEDQHDSDLLARIIERDRGALTELYGRYYGPLLRFLQRLTGDLESAREAVNDVMLTVWSSASKFRGDSKVSTWVMGIAYRKGMKLKTRMQTWTVRFKAQDWEEVVERSARVEGHTREVLDRDLMYRAMQLLPPKQRAVVELTYYSGCSYEEIAEIVNCPVNTVKTRMFHARARLRELLPQLGHDSGDR
jgi:RNA polymerase sigma-70 factor (ECF subfamily)